MTEELARFIIGEIINKNTIKVDYSSCYFYGEFQDMNATVSHCNYYENHWDYCPCLDGKDCDKYINKKEAHKMIKEWVDAEG